MMTPLFTGTLAPRSKIQITGAKPSDPTQQLVIVARPRGAIRQAMQLDLDPVERSPALRVMRPVLSLDNDNDAGATYMIFSLPRRLVALGLPLAVAMKLDIKQADILIPKDPT